MTTNASPRGQQGRSGASLHAAVYDHPAAEDCASPHARVQGRGEFSMGAKIGFQRAPGCVTSTDRAPEPLIIGLPREIRQLLTALGHAGSNFNLQQPPLTLDLTTQKQQWQDQLAAVCQTLVRRGPFPSKLRLWLGVLYDGSEPVTPDKQPTVVAQHKAEIHELEQLLTQHCSHVCELDIDASVAGWGYSYLDTDCGLPPLKHMPDLVRVRLNMAGLRGAAEQCLCTAVARYMPQLRALDITWSSGRPMWPELFTHGPASVLTDITTSTDLTQELLELLLQHVPSLTQLSVRALQCEDHRALRQGQPQAYTGRVWGLRELCVREGRWWGEVAIKPDVVARLPASKGGTLWVAEADGVCKYVVLSNQVVETTLRQAIPRTKVTPYTLTILPHETLTYTEQLTALYRTLPDMQHLQDRVSAIDLSGKWLWSAGLLQVLLEASETCRNIGVVFNGPLTYSTLKLFRAAHEQHRVFKTVHTQPLQLQLLSQPRPDNQPMWSLEAEHYLAYRSAVGPATQQQQQQQQQTRREPQLHKVAFTGVASEGRGQYISGLSMCEELGFSEPFVSDVQCKDLLALMHYGLRFQMLRCARATLPQCIAQDDNLRKALSSFQCTPLSKQPDDTVCLEINTGKMGEQAKALQGLLPALRVRDTHKAIIRLTRTYLDINELTALQQLPHWHGMLDLSQCMWVAPVKDIERLVQHIPTSYSTWRVSGPCGAVASVFGQICEGLNKCRAGLGLLPLRLMTCAHQGEDKRVGEHVIVCTGPADEVA